MIVTVTDFEFERHSTQPNPRRYGNIRRNTYILSGKSAPPPQSGHCHPRQTKAEAYGNFPELLFSNIISTSDKKLNPQRLPFPFVTALQPVNPSNRRAS